MTEEKTLGHCKKRLWKEVERNAEDEECQIS